MVVYLYFYLYLYLLSTARSVELLKLDCCLSHSIESTNLLIFLSKNLSIYDESIILLNEPIHSLILLTHIRYTLKSTPNISSQSYRH